MFMPAGLFLFVFYIYLRTVCATFNINDSGETIMVCKLLTISHSPGYPLHTLWGNVCCNLPLGKPMFRVTFCSLLTGSVSVMMLYMVVKMMLKEIFVPSEGQNPESSTPENSWILEVSALFGALIFAFSYQHWFQSCGAKGGIYTLNSFLSITMLYLFFKMREKGWFIKSILMMAFLFGLSVAHHWPNQIAMAPGYLWFFLASQKRESFSGILKCLLRPFDLIEKLLNVLSAIGLTNLMRGLTMLVLSLSAYLYLPIRAVEHPLVNWWNPNNLERLWGTVVRKGYQGIGDKRSVETTLRVFDRFMLHAHHQFGDYFTWAVVALSLLGLYWLFRRQWSSAVGVFLFGGGIFGAILVFNNPLEGYQWTVDNFFTPVFMTVAMLAASGIAGICEWTAKKWPSPVTSLYSGAFCMGLAFVPLLLNFQSGTQNYHDLIPYNGSGDRLIYVGNDQSHYVSSYDEGMNMLKTVNRNGVILCNGDIDILPLWYLQFVEGKRPEIVSFTMQLIPYDWYREPLMTRWPFLAVPMRYDNYGRVDIRPETVVQDMIDQHAKDRSFYYTNIFTAQWMREKNQSSLPDGFLWRISNTKDLNYPFTSTRLNQIWSTYRLRYMEPENRGYWDEYTDVMKDSYGIGHDFTGYFAYMNKMYDIALWSFDNALKYRQPQTLSRIYLMQGETRLALGDYSNAVNSYQECIRREPRNPYAFAKIGDAFRMMNDPSDAEQAYRAALSINPQQKEALEGLQLLAHATPLGPSAAR
jgi:hypothetical protein